jgi:benzodiazapine receptor
MGQMRLIRWKPLAIAGIAAFLVAAAGGALTEVGPWFGSLIRPWFQPPNWVFGPAWTTIFALCAVAAARAWTVADDDRQRSRLIALFAVNSILNVGWSLLFFKLHRPDWALVEIAFLWASIVSLIVYIRRFDWPAAVILVPYLVWVSFASVLNWEVVRLNEPFG